MTKAQRLKKACSVLRIANCPELVRRRVCVEV